jgi:hypothetical protein
LIALLVSVTVAGSAAMILRYGVVPMASNMAYSAAQRGAMSPMEMLSKEIAAAGEVEIISDGAHVLAAGLEEDWHYVVLNSGRKEVRHVYREEGNRVEEKISGSGMEALSFDTEVFPTPLDGGRLLRVYVKAAYGSEDDTKTVELDRSMVVRAARGVTGENGAAPGAGPVLRYKLRASCLTEPCLTAEKKDDE